MRMRQLNLVSGAVLWCVHFDEISSTSSILMYFISYWKSVLYHISKKRIIFFPVATAVAIVFYKGCHFVAHARQNVQNAHSSNFLLKSDVQWLL
jgi:hypothetical protein